MQATYEIGFIIANIGKVRPCTRENVLCIVVPGFNEETQIERVITTMPDYVDKILIVDDKSSDNTASIVKWYQEETDKINLIRHEENQGVCGAIATGYKWARDNDIDLSVLLPE